MKHKPATTYIVSVFDKPHWRTILTSSDKGEAEAHEQAMSQDGTAEAQCLEGGSR